MPPQKTIVIDFPTNTNGLLTHQIQNFGEDLWRAIEQAGLGDVGGLDAVDIATDRLVVRINRTRKIATVRKLVAEMLREHFLDYRSDVTFE